MPGASADTFRTSWRISCELDSDRPGQQARGLSIAQQAPDRLPATVAVVERQAVHVHADETIGACVIEPAPELHGVLDGFLTMIQAVCNAVVEQA